jgi:monofunctional glycosyltransferase
MADAKRRNGGRWALGTAAVALAWLLGVWPPPLWWRDHWPRETALMREAAGGTGHAAGALGRPTPLGQLPPLLQRMVIIGEDSRFRTHHGIDPAEIGDALGLDHGHGVWETLTAAWNHRDQLRGASTITQQLAKNLYLSPSRNPLRKVKEAVTALQLELELPKDRILELYLNVAEWGPGIWGADAASRAYFGVPASRLTEEQAAGLAATLPHPLSSNPAVRPERMLARRELILARYRGVEVSIPVDEEISATDATAATTAPGAPVDSLAPALPAHSTADSLATPRPDIRADTPGVARDSLP